MPHVVWALMAMKLVSGLQGTAQADLDPATGRDYVPVDSVSHFEQVQVAVYTDQYTCQVWAQRINHMSGYQANSAQCLQKNVQ